MDKSEISVIKLPISIFGRNYLPLRSGSISVDKLPEFSPQSSFPPVPYHHPVTGGFAMSHAAFRRLARFKNDTLEFVMKLDGSIYEFKAVIKNWKPIERFFERFDKKTGRHIIVRRFAHWIDVQVVNDLTLTSPVTAA